jgi:hypothetical protein
MGPVRLDRQGRQQRPNAVGLKTFNGLAIQLGLKGS